jgi:hypothetical protein
MPIKDVEKRRAYMRAYAKRRKIQRVVNVEYERARLKERYAERRQSGLCHVCGKQSLNGESKCEKCKRTAKTYVQKVKKATLAYYGGSCACCGETELAFLTIDHINGGGCKHRKENGFGSLYGWLKRNGYPEGFQVLCMNCNLGKYLCGACPHQQRK